MRQALLILILAMAGVFGTASAVHNANMIGQLEGFYVYADGDYIYFRLKNQPTSHSACDPSYFVIPETVPADRRKMMLVRLSLAYAMQEHLTVGYDSLGDCVHGYIRVHRVG